MRSDNFLIGFIILAIDGIIMYYDWIFKFGEWAWNVRDVNITLGFIVAFLAVLVMVLYFISIPLGFYVMFTNNTWSEEKPKKVKN